MTTDNFKDVIESLLTPNDRAAILEIAEQMLETMATPIDGVPTVTINNYSQAKQIAYAALSAVFAMQKISTEDQS